ncbi:SGNH hydrolase-like domain-containing protein, acetyltransferase AlgX [Pricia antarctica]|uniref:SGNH hydrolase-like domain-containing protein, acetyltransferase AlgX n=1 Tax=Pricia antarctica TaxID=641691 RepID=A0A1G6X343_9FLAO|nr:DHHW family protein [Pricia antarctica]SDD71817.1 SGNH hydrolase-like domain-containing protein, acetyltransferase AlgX [Pricia antarctica]
MVKKYATALLIAFLVFVTTCLLMGITGAKPTEITVSLSATVLKDDVFQVFYSNQGEGAFTEKQSAITEIKGGGEPQTIEFVIPLDTSLTQLRIDIGNNRNQMPINFSTVRLRTHESSYAFDISKSFLKNVCITEKDGKFITRTVLNSYDPFFISNFDLSPILEKLAKKQPLVANKVAYFLALIFAVAAFISFSLKKIRLANLRPNGYIFAFVLIIAAPPIVKLFGLEQKTESMEKRELAKQPEWAFKESFPREYEAYYNDNFGLRPTIINWASDLKIGLFRDSPQPELVQFGKNGFLFFNEHNELDGGIYSSYSHTNLASRKQLENAFRKQFDLKQDLTKLGIRYAVGFWPNKHSIYNSSLPFTMKIQVQGETSLADQAVRFFEEKGMPLFDVRHNLLKNKNEKQLYFKFDSHWNANGAYLAYRNFCEQTFNELGLTPFPVEDFDISYSKIRNGDLTNLLGIDSISGYYDKKPNYKFKNSNSTYHFVNPGGIYQNTFVTENNNCGNDKVALVFRDSYGAALVQFLSLHYSRVVYVAKSPVDMYWVNQVNPDVVILGVVERRLPYILDTVGKSVDSLP